MRLRDVGLLAVTVALVGSTLTGASLGQQLEQRRAKPSLSVLENRVHSLKAQVRQHEKTRRQMNRWWRCIKPLRVDQIGDQQHAWGFEFDERDGTGIDTRPALVRREKKGRPDLLLLRFRRAGRCTTRAPDPNGTGADARGYAAQVLGEEDRASTADSWGRLGRLENQVAKLNRRIHRLEKAFDRFDEWESCLSWLPVTEYGHDHQELGYLYGSGAAPTYLGAIDIDGSEWDDPDYELLAFIGRDRPFKKAECGHEPGESVDRHSASQRGGLRERGARQWNDRLDEVRSALHAAQEDVEDLLEPVQEFIQFDECMFTVGMRSLGSSAHGYRFIAPSGNRSQRAALSFDMTGLQLPQWDVMAFPGEEPPQIECNEDAGGQDTDE